MSTNITSCVFRESKRWGAKSEWFHFKAIYLTIYINKASTILVKLIYSMLRIDPLIASSPSQLPRVIINENEILPHKKNRFNCFKKQTFVLNCVLNFIFCPKNCLLKNEHETSCPSHLAGFPGLERSNTVHTASLTLRLDFSIIRAFNHLLKTRPITEIPKGPYVPSEQAGKVSRLFSEGEK